MIMTIDLTYPIHAGMFKYPKDPEVEVEADQARVDENKKVLSGYASYRLRNHHGTHVDAPAHKIPNGNRIDAYTPEKFINNALIIDLSDLAARSGKGITFEDVDARIDLRRMHAEDITALLFYTGYCDLIEKYDGTLFGGKKQEFEKQFTYFTPEAAGYVASLAPFLNIAGIDSFSFDRSGSNSESHLAFLKNDILLLETIVNLKELVKVAKGSGFRLNCVPILYSHADAAQTRAYAEFQNGVK